MKICCVGKWALLVVWRSWVITESFSEINWSSGYTQTVTTERLFNVFEMLWHFREYIYWKRLRTTSVTFAQCSIFWFDKGRISFLIISISVLITSCSSCTDLNNASLRSFGERGRWEQGSSPCASGLSLWLPRAEPCGQGEVGGQLCLLHCTCLGLDPSFSCLSYWH